MLFLGFLRLHHRHLGPENPNSPIRISRRTFPARLLPRELVERDGEGQVRVHVQLQSRDALLPHVHGLHSHLCQRQPEGQIDQVNKLTNL